jgi:hypothetical protein
MEVFESFELLHNGVSWKRCVNTVEAHTLDGSDLSRNHTQQETFQLAVGTTWNRDVVEVIDRERCEDCLMVYLTTAPKQIQVETPANPVRISTFSVRLQASRDSQYRLGASMQNESRLYPLDHLWGH